MSEFMQGVIVGALGLVGLVLSALVIGGKTGVVQVCTWTDDDDDDDEFK